jgi:aryl-alcohol dehydrogenase-like predicted oxidoreductase
VVERLRKIAAEHDASVAQAAIAWLLAKKDVTSVLVGASKLQQLDDNLGAANLSLSDAEMAELDAATALFPVYPNWFIERLQDQVTAQALTR